MRRLRLWLACRILPRGYEVRERTPWRQLFGTVRISGLERDLTIPGGESGELRD